MDNNKKPKPVALYIRFAHPPHHEESAQKMSLLEYAKKQGITDLEIYADYGYSGITLNRPAFQKMLADIESGKIGRVIAHDVSGISRDHVQMYGFVNLLKKNGVMFDTPNHSHKFMPLDTNQFLKMNQRKKRSDKDHER